MRLRIGRRKKKRTLPYDPDVFDGGMRTVESAVDRMIDEGLGGGNTDPHVNASLDPIPPDDDEDDEKQ